jgi:hypothetical protein
LSVTKLEDVLLGELLCPAPLALSAFVMAIARRSLLAKAIRPA